MSLLDGNSADPDTESLLRRVIEIIRAPGRCRCRRRSSSTTRRRCSSCSTRPVTTCPEETRQARWLLKERDEFLAKMQREGDDILQAARLQAERMVQRTEIVREAQATARRTVEDGRDEARRLRLEAEDYCDQKLAAFEVVLDRTIKTVAAGRERLSIDPAAGAGRSRRRHRRDRAGRHPGRGGRLLRSGPDLTCRTGAAVGASDWSGRQRGGRVTANPWLVPSHHPAPPGRARAARSGGPVAWASCRSSAAWCRRRPRSSRTCASIPSTGASRWPPRSGRPGRASAGAAFAH